MDSTFAFIFLTIFAVAVVVFLMAIFQATYVVKQAEIIIIERFGKFHSILHPGIHVVIPFMDQARKVVWSFAKEDPNTKRYYQYIEIIDRIDLRESVFDFPKQNVITKDNVTMEINAILYYQITDPVRAVYEINNVSLAIEKLAQTALRDIVGSMDLDETLSSRDFINEKLRIRLDEATDKWGVKVNRVELQDVNPPLEIRMAMEKQMRAERDRRAHILVAEGNKSSEILEAEGEKQSRIERARGEAEAKITLANAEAESRITIARAEAEVIELIKNALPSKDPASFIIASKYIQALPEITKDKEGKMILVPYEASAMMGAFSGIKEILSNGNSKS